jgi:C4-type Zn-finger protein
MDCPICYENREDYVFLSCKHKICLTCYFNSVIFYIYKCPLCRKKISEMKAASKYAKECENKLEELEIENEKLLNENKDLKSKIKNEN